MAYSSITVYPFKRILKDRLNGADLLRSFVNS